MWLIGFEALFCCRDKILHVYAQFIHLIKRMISGMHLFLQSELNNIFETEKRHKICAKAFLFSLTIMEA